GGGLFNSGGEVTLDRTTVSGNAAVFGGALFSSGVLTIFRSRIIDNLSSVTGAGAGLRVSGGWVRISETTFARNNAGGDTALDVEQGSVFITESAFDQNVAFLRGFPVSVGQAARLE